MPRESPVAGGRDWERETLDCGGGGGGGNGGGGGSGGGVGVGGGSGVITNSGRWSRGLTGVVRSERNNHQKHRSLDESKLLFVQAVVL